MRVQLHPINKLLSALTVSIGALLLIAGARTTSYAQGADLYSFSATDGTFTEITGGTEVSSIETDDALSSAIDIGFTFNYCGTDYTQVKVSSNGWVTFNTSVTSSNTFNSTSSLSGISPALMPLWDDLSGAVGEARYEMEGTAPNRVLTIQWKDWRWNYNSTYDATISFQVKLYETTNVIDYIYRQETGTGNTSGSTGATIGIASGTSTPLYLLLNNASASPTASTSTFTDDITARPATGQVYTFTPPEPCSGTPAPGNALSSVDSACAATPFTLSLSEPITNSGLTFQWYSSPAGAGTFTAITGATAANYTVTNQAAATDYYCEVTCTAGNASANTDTISVGQNPANECYCIPTYTYGCNSNDYVDDFILTGAGGTSINDLSTGCVGGDDAYDDRTDESVDLMQSISYNGQISAGTGGDNARIWIDFNDDGAFDEDETVATVSAISTSGTTDFSLLIPLTANPGSHRMRVRLVWSTAATSITPCDNSSYGETVDYMANILVLPDCSGVPQAGTIDAPTDICPNIQFTMSMPDVTIANGVTYQWYSSPLGSGTFTAIPGATAPTYTVVSQTAGTDYFCEVTCTLSNETVYSDTASVVENPPTQCYCLPPENTYGSSYNITSFETTNGVTNITNDNSGNSDNYGDFTDMQASGIQSTAINFSVTTESNADLAIYADWNQDGDFDDPGEQVYTLNEDYGDPTTVTGSFTIPATALLDTTRLRVRSNAYYYSVPDECDEEEYGETEDYSFVVLPMPACATVTFPDSVGATAAPTSLCVSGDVYLNLASPMPVASGITYQWQTSATETGTYSNIGTAAATPAYTYNTGTSYWYHCLVKCDGTTILTSDPIQVEAVVPSTPVANDGQHCGPGTVVLSGTVGSGTIFWYPDETTALPIATGDTFTTPDLAATTTYYISAGASPTVDTVVGTGTSSSSSSASPFYNSYGDSWKHQYLIRASELTAAGFLPGATISRIGVDVTSSSPSGIFDNFSVAADTTSVNALSDFIAGLPSQFTNAAYAPVSGPNMFPLASPIVWDGTSNIIVQTCYYDENAEATSVNVRYGTVSGSMVYGYAYDADACDEPEYGPYTSSSRPNFYLTQQGCESDRVLITAYIRDTPVVDLGPDESLCGDANQSVTLDAGNEGATYVWSDGSTDQTLTVNQSGTYYVTVTNEYGCASSDTTHKEILLAPEVHLGNDTTICNGVTLTLSAGDDGIIYYWNTGDTINTIDVNSTGTYSVIVTNELDCTVSDTINVTVEGDLPTIDAILVTNVGPYTFKFEAFNPQGAITGYTWAFGDGDTSNEVSPTHTYQSEGNYQVTLVLNTATCGLLTYTTSTHIVGVNDISVDDAVLNLYPNPAKDVVTIENKGSFRMEELVITNAVGQVMERKVIENGVKKYQVNLSGYANGIYSVRIKTDKGFVVRRFEVLK